MQLLYEIYHLQFLVFIQLSLGCVGQMPSLKFRKVTHKHRSKPVQMLEPNES